MKEIRDKIDKLIEILNENPTLENLIRVEHKLDFYSDVYKDENGFRPDLYRFRSKYSEEANAIKSNWEAMPNRWEIYLNY